MKKIKITYQQAAILKKIAAYNQVFTKVDFNNLIKESTSTNVDNVFKSAFANKNVQNLGEDKFDITKPDPSIPKLNPQVMHRGSLSEDMNAGGLHNAVVKLVSDIYNNPSQVGLDRFWVENGVTWGDLFQFLTAMGLLITGIGGTIQLAKKAKSKFFSTPQEAIKAVEDAIGVLLKKKMRNNIQRTNVQQPLDNDMSIGENDDTTDEPTDGSLYTAIAINKEIAILKDSNGELYVFYFSDDDDFFDLEAVEHFVNSRRGELSTGEGLADFEGGKDLVKIDDILKQELLDLYDKDAKIVESLSSLSETTVCGSSASGGSSGPFVGPLNMPIIKKDIPVIAEGPVAGTSADGGSTGPYDANAFPNISGNGTYKKPKKSKAEISTQYPQGSFVDIDDCTKLNNNKDAANGKCSNGAADNVVKQRKGKGSIISKSALLHEVMDSINELGGGDWKVQGIMNFCNTPENIVTAYKVITNSRPIKAKVDDLLVIINNELSELGKEDVDFIYAKLIGV